MCGREKGQLVGWIGVEACMSTDVEEMMAWCKDVCVWAETISVCIAGRLGLHMENLMDGGLLLLHHPIDHILWFDCPFFSDVEPS